MSPNASPRPLAASISVVYEDDVEAASEALLALLRHAHAPVPCKDPDDTPSPEESAA